MKERFTNVAQKTLDVFVKFASTKAITALKDGFVLSMPITLVGSIFLLIANLPITGYTDFMARIFGSDWNLGLNQINNSTFNVLAMVIAVGIGYSYARNEKMDGISCGILTLVSFRHRRRRCGGGRARPRFRTARPDVSRRSKND